MTFSHIIDHQRGYMETHVTGAVTLEDMRAHWEAELAEGGESYPELIDAAGATVDFGAEEVRRLVGALEVSSRTRQLGPTAIVVGSDIAFGMIRMLGMLVEPFCQVRPFRDRDAARAWLDTFPRVEGHPPG
jgi:hypothetical protein